MERPAVVQCLQCKAQLVISASSSNSNLDGSFPGGMPATLDESFLVLDQALGGRHAPQGGQGSALPSDPMEESFVVLQESSARRTHATPATTTTQRFTIHDRMQALARVLELASEETRIDQPLCTDCAADVQRELEAQVEDLETEVAAYAALEERLRAEHETGGLAPLEERAFQKELRKAQEEVRVEETKLAKLQSELAATEAQCATAAAASTRLAAVEDRYWHAFNAVMLALHAASDLRESLQQRVDSAEASISSLRRTSVLADLFQIWYDGPFGTVSGLRLGSVPASHVEWWEINAAWGQAVLLLDTLARALGVSFTSYRLEPRGSYSRVHDSKGPAELFGPANKLLCLSYDRAQVGFLACMRQFAEALASRGATEDGRPFVLKYLIEGDRIGDQSIRYGLSRDKGWTKALKYMLVDLKYCLKATLAVLDRRRVASVAALPREGPTQLAVPRRG